MLRKGGSNWVEGSRFFNREVELEALQERVNDGTHTLLTAQRRMGKTSLVRELMRRLHSSDRFETVFVDIEAAADPADAIAEISVRSRPLRGAFDGIKASFVNVLRETSDRIEQLSVADLKVKLRAGIDSGNWSARGDGVFAALAASDKPVVLAIDELPILVNRLLKGNSDHITSEGRTLADAFLSWLRRNGQTHRGRVTMIVSGSVGLEPLLQQARLSAHANIFAPYDLHPWNEQTAIDCLAALAKTYEIDLSREISQLMCRRLRCCIPHHIQIYFDKLHDYLRLAGRQKVLAEDVERVYLQEMLSVRGQVDLQHYEARLETILGRSSYPIALEMLTATAKTGRLAGTVVDRYRDYFPTGDEYKRLSVQDVLNVLCHDGYLYRQDDGYQFVSGLLEDWWRSRYARHFVSVLQPEANPRGTGR